MKYCFVGVGSIAKKHIANIRKLDSHAVIHAFRSSKSKTDCVLDKEIFDFNDLDDKYDAIFITNPTSMHFATLQQFKNKSDCFFVEKPVFSHYVNKNELSGFLNKKTYVAAPLRYCAGVQYAKEMVKKKGNPISLRIISSSYLPDWRPGVDYRNVYSAHKDMGGGVHIDLIHELDYLVYLLGKPKKSVYLNNRVSNLEIDSYDVSASIHRYPYSVAEIHLDYFGRDKKRICELYFNDEVQYIDLINNDVTIVKNGKRTKKVLEPQDMYLSEMKYFLNYLKGKTKKSTNSLSLANDVLKIINKGEK